VTTIGCGGAGLAAVGWLGCVAAAGDWLAGGVGEETAAGGCVAAPPCCPGVVEIGAKGSGAAWASNGAAQIRLPNAMTPDFKIHPP